MCSTVQFIECRQVKGCFKCKKTHCALVSLCIFNGRTSTKEPGVADRFIFMRRGALRDLIRYIPADVGITQFMTSPRPLLASLSANDFPTVVIIYSIAGECNEYLFELLEKWAWTEALLRDCSSRWRTLLVP